MEEMAAVEARYTFAVIQVIRARRALIGAVVRTAKTATAGQVVVDLTSTTWKIELSPESQSDLLRRRELGDGTLCARFAAGFIVTQHTDSARPPVILRVSPQRTSDHVALAFVFTAGWRIWDWQNETCSIVWGTDDTTALFPWEVPQSPRRRDWNISFDSEKVGTW